MSAAFDIRPSILDYAHGLHPNVPEDVYHQRVLGMASVGALRRLERSPAHYYAWVTGEIDDKETPALSLGRAAHAAILEPERFDRTYVIAPDFGPTRANADQGVTKEQGKANKTRKEEWEAAHKGATILESSGAKATMGMIKAIRKHPLAANLIAGGIPEQTVRWKDSETGLECRARGDLYRPDLATCVDVKSTLNASERPFTRDMAKLGYHRIDAFYRAGFAAVGAPIKHYAFLAVEKEPPYEIAIYTLDSESIGRAHMAVRALMATMAECLASGQWPGYARRLQELTLPPWAD